MITGNTRKKTGQGDFVTKADLKGFADTVLFKIEEKIDENKRYLEAKIEYSRKDTKEHSTSLFKGLSKRVDGIEKRFDNVEAELKITQQALKSTKTDLETQIRETKTDLETQIRETKTDLETQINGVETRLSDKIDKIGDRVENHENRIVTLESIRR